MRAPVSDMQLFTCCYGMTVSLNNEGCLPHAGVFHLLMQQEMLVHNSNRATSGHQLEMHCQVGQHRVTE
jgi:hypothetical protein